MTPWEALAGAITRLNDRFDGLPSFREATVSSLSPLSVQFDTDTDGTIVQGTLASGVATGYRVMTMKLRHYVWIIGIKGGDNLGGMTGEVRMFAGAVPPAGGWLLCRGQAVLRADYPELYAALGDRYGAGNGTTTFNVPNFQGKVPVGKNPSDTDFDTLGKSGGEKAHTLTINEMPQHDHDFAGQTILWGATGNVHFDNVQAIAGPSGGNGTYTWQDTDGWADTYARGGGAAHNNLQPYVVMDYIIKT